MPRVKRGKQKNQKRKKVLKYTKGFRWGRKSKKRAAKEALLHAWDNKFRERKKKKRRMRRLWNIKINAGARQHGMKYSTFISALKKNNVRLDRKILAHLAEHEPEIFKQVVEKVKS